MLIYAYWWFIVIYTCEYLACIKVCYYRLIYRVYGVVYV